MVMLRLAVDEDESWCGVLVAAVEVGFEFGITDPVPLLFLLVRDVLLSKFCYRANYTGGFAVYRWLSVSTLVLPLISCCSF
jgi:hypothetical protein